MNYVIDHDLHIHSKLSSCSNDERQSTADILKYAEDNGLGCVCVTDHFWSEMVDGASEWYKPQNFAHISESLPLPQSDKVRFYFGCEAEMDKHFKLGIAPEDFDRFDFVIIPTTHLHMRNFTIEEGAGIERRAELYAERLERLLSYDLPFDKIGIAHLTCPLIAPGDFSDHIEVINRVDDQTFSRLFAKSAAVGVGIELNLNASSYSVEQFDMIMRPYKIAKCEGCKFYLGSDAHHPERFDGMIDNFKKIVEYLDLKESDKFNPFK